MRCLKEFAINLQKSFFNQFVYEEVFLKASNSFYISHFCDSKPTFHGFSYYCMFLGLFLCCDSICSLNILPSASCNLRYTYHGFLICPFLRMWSKREKSPGKKNSRVQVYYQYHPYTSLFIP